jgi:hypothetical protein
MALTPAMLHIGAPRPKKHAVCRDINPAPFAVFPPGTQGEHGLRHPALLL